LINEAKKNKVKKFIYISSAKVLGEFSKKMIMENSKPKPKTEYAKSKLYTENFLISIGKTYNIDVICLRPTVVYGNGCKGNLRNLLRIMNMNLLPEIKKTNNKISLLHVKDLCEAIIKVIFSKKRGGLFVVSGPSDLSLDEIISFMRKAINKKETYFKINLNILILINIILKKINLFGIFNRISLLIDKFFRSSFYESKKFSKCYNWKPKVYPSDGFFEMINGE
jgi:nucleoside-diphosphate-sugar epimerase